MASSKWTARHPQAASHRTIACGSGFARRYRSCRWRNRRFAGTDASASKSSVGQAGRPACRSHTDWAGRVRSIGTRLGRSEWRGGAVFSMRSMASGPSFHRAYQRLSKAFLEAHEHAFGYFGGVFRVFRYDNLKAAVKKIVRGFRREETARFIAFRSHWRFASEFCTPEEPHRKGGIEGEVGYFRRNHWVPIPKARVTWPYVTISQRRGNQPHHGRIPPETPCQCDMPQISFDNLQQPAVWTIWCYRQSKPISRSCLSQSAGMRNLVLVQAKSTPLEVSARDSGNRVPGANEVHASRVRRHRRRDRRPENTTRHPCYIGTPSIWPLLYTSLVPYTPSETSLSCNPTYIAARNIREDPGSVGRNRPRSRGARA
jgi:hypothetical protein